MRKITNWRTDFRCCKFWGWSISIDRVVTKSGVLLDAIWRIAVRACWPTFWTEIVSFFDVVARVNRERNIWTASTCCCQIGNPREQRSIANDLYWELSLSRYIETDLAMSVRQLHGRINTHLWRRNSEHLLCGKKCVSVYCNRTANEKRHSTSNWFALWVRKHAGHWRSGQYTGDRSWETSYNSSAINQRWTLHLHQIVVRYQLQIIDEMPFSNGLLIDGVSWKALGKQESTYWKTWSIVSLRRVDRVTGTHLLRLARYLSYRTLLLYRYCRIYLVLDILKHEAETIRQFCKNLDGRKVPQE